MSGSNQSEVEGNSFVRQEIPARIGTGFIGGKASGLAGISEHIHSRFQGDDTFADFQINIPGMAVLCSDVFAAFLDQNKVDILALESESDHRIANRFHAWDIPFSVLGELREITDKLTSPLAVRSSSLLEDALESPFAGIYATKMIPNNEPDPDIRFKKLIAAIKFVYASTFFRNARDYRRAINVSPDAERMSVIIQEVVGTPHFDRYYPDISGVARSINYYPINRSKSEDGIVHLALGLGKTIVDGSRSWWYSPSQPRVNPPFLDINELLKQTQTSFWAVNLGKPPDYDPSSETEYLIKAGLKDAEYDDTLSPIVSTYDPANDRIQVGLMDHGPRILTFAPILVYNQLPLNALIKAILEMCESAYNSPVEIEFALTMNPLRFGLLQVRKMASSSGDVSIAEADLTSRDVLLGSRMALGNGERTDITDIIFVKPDSFDPAHSRTIAQEIDTLNRTLLESDRTCLLIGFGRWGSSDPWLGIPVTWGQISQAKVIVESTLPNMDKEFSQGSHFFHNITSFGVSYFSVRYSSQEQIDWDWLLSQDMVEELSFVRHVRTHQPIPIRVDGRTGLGVILKPDLPE